MTRPGAQPAAGSYLQIASNLDTSTVRSPLAVSGSRR
jgi:hypothetical protein